MTRARDLANIADGDISGTVTLDDIAISGNISKTGDLTLDVSGDIVLDADGGTLKFKDGGTHIANIGNSSSDLVIENKVQDKDIKFLGDDGGAGVTALTLDMSAAGAATFNSSVDAGAGLRLSTDGSNNAVIQALGQDKDIYFSGDDGGSGVNALILDMSAAGAATFNSFVYLDYIRGKSDTNTGINIAGSDALSFQTGGVNRLNITSGGYLEAISASQVRLTLGSEGTAGTNNANWIRGNGTSLGFNSASGGYQFEVGGTERFRINPSGDLQLGGTTNAGFIDFDSSSLQLNTQRNPNTGTFQNTGRAHASIVLSDGNGTASNSYIRFLTANSNNTVASERMRIDSTGQWFLGKTSTSVLTDGHYFTAAGFASHCRTSSFALTVTRNTDDGANINIIGYDSQAGFIGSDKDGSDSCIYIANDDVGFLFNSQYNAIYPFSHDSLNIIDAHIDLGYASGRMEDYFAVNGTIQTSDINEKQQIAALTNAEINAAIAISKLFKTFKWNSAVTKKGDAARTHAGVIAQEVETAMSDKGLDATKYAFWCSDTWWETQEEVAAVEAVEAKDAVYDDDGNTVSEAVEAVEAKEAYTRTHIHRAKEDAPEGATERNRKGIRYPELLSFLGAATEQRLTNIETRLTALEAN